MDDGPDLVLLHGLGSEGEGKGFAPIDVSMLLLVGNIHVARLTGMIILDGFIIYIYQLGDAVVGCWGMGSGSILAGLFQH